MKAGGGGGWKLAPMDGGGGTPGGGGGGGRKLAPMCPQELRHSLHRSSYSSDKQVIQSKKNKCPGATNTLHKKTVKLIY